MELLVASSMLGRVESQTLSDVTDSLSNNPTNSVELVTVVFVMVMVAVLLALRLTLFAVAMLMVLMSKLMASHLHSVVFRDVFHPRLVGRDV